jgi:L-ribulose-5-phosphate 3-epimerase
METTFPRRSFLRTALTLAATPMLISCGRNDQTKEIGLYIALTADDLEKSVARVRQLGFTSVAFYMEDTSLKTAHALKNAMSAEGVNAAALMTLGPGATEWNFCGGPQTIGLVPRRFRQQRIDALKRASDFAKTCEIPAIETHAGFITENPNDELYAETVKALEDVVDHCRGNRQTFLYHAGQETPTTLVRTIHDVGRENQGIGLDTANLIMYDKGHPFFALDVYGAHLRIVYAKDGVYPTNTRDLGAEVQIGKGAVDFPRFIKKLKQMNFQGPIVIERETSGRQWEEDVKASKIYLEKLLNM